MSKNSLQGRLESIKTKIKKKGALKNNKKIYLTAMMLIAVGCFFYAGSPQPEFFAHTYEQKDEALIKIDLKKDIAAQNVLAAKSTAGNGYGKNVKLAINQKTSKIESEIYAIVGETPIKKMVPFIARHDQTVAGLIVGIAKKESSWGEHVPTLEGQDCFNYWGYKGAGSRGSAMGYGCFASPEEGVEVIGARIAELVNKNLTTPSKMVVWKCGSSCAGHDPVAVQKWISDVNLYFSRIVAFAG